MIFTKDHVTAHSSLPSRQLRQPKQADYQALITLTEQLLLSQDDSTDPTEMAEFLAYQALMHADDGKKLTYNKLLKGQEGHLWAQEGSKEWDRLIEGTKTLRFVSADTKPHDQRATYVKHVCTDKIKSQGQEAEKRVRTTVGGDKIEFDGDTAAYTAALKTIKLLWNAVLSTPLAKFMTIDIRNFYLHSRLEKPEYAWVQLAQIPEATRQKYAVAGLVKDGKVLVEITGGIYGLPQSGILAQRDLLKTLEAAGYYMTGTNCLFRHRTRDIMFTLIVDDFGVMYTREQDAQHLMDTLTAVYEIKMDWSGSRFLGITLDWDYDVRSLTTSMPDFVLKALQRYAFDFSQPKSHSPGGWKKPNYGAAQQLVEVDDSPRLSTEDGLLLMSIIGTFLWYCRVLDYTGLVALGQLGQEVAHPTAHSLERAQDVLRYFATYPTAAVVYRASDMILRVHSDGSYLSEPRAGSRLAGIEYLGSEGDEDLPPTNGLINVVCCRSDVVLSSACETEWAAIFKTCKEAVESRQTLQDLGFPQKPTIVTSDNVCAVGLSNGTITKPKRSKAMDMRFHWVKDRVRQGQFIVRWAPGDKNYADFFTKLHPVKHHRLLRQFYVTDIISA